MVGKSGNREEGSGIFTGRRADRTVMQQVKRRERFRSILFVAPNRIGAKLVTLEKRVTVWRSEERGGTYSMSCFPFWVLVLLWMLPPVVSHVSEMKKNQVRRAIVAAFAKVRRLHCAAIRVT